MLLIFQPARAGDRLLVDGQDLSAGDTIDVDDERAEQLQAEVGPELAPTSTRASKRPASTRKQR